MKWYNLVFVLLVSSVFIQCSDDNTEQEEDEPIETELSSYRIIQKEIFDKNCVSCHQAGTSFAKQSDLILTEDVSYSQLVNRKPNNIAARADGLLLVGTEGLISLSTSFLWEKINTLDYAHYYDDHSDYGELMPLGAKSLTNGELRFIKEWIRLGASEIDNNIDVNILTDTERFEIPLSDFIKLDPPAKGLQLNLGPFDLKPNRDREFHYFMPLNNSEELYLDRVEISMRAGSHHMILYDYPEGQTPPENTFRDLYNNDGSYNYSTVFSIVNQRFVFGTQWRNTDYSYPAGVALKLPANTGFDLNSHYVNNTDEEKIGEVSINLHTVSKDKVKYVAEILFESYDDFKLPAGVVTTLERTSTFDQRINLFQLTSHAHRHMTEFEIYIAGGDRDGELILYTQDWEHPPLLTFDPPIVLERGEGLRSRATYNNDTNRTLKFGTLSEDEMMIIFGAFYTD